MSDIIVASEAELENDSELLQSIMDALRSGNRNDIIEILDPSHSELEEPQRNEILRERYHDQLIKDGLSTGHFIIDDSGRIRIAIQQPLHTIVGYVFEAYAVRKFNDQKKLLARMHTYGPLKCSAYIAMRDLKKLMP